MIVAECKAQDSLAGRQKQEVSIDRLYRTNQGTPRLREYAADRRV